MFGIGLIEVAEEFSGYDHQHLFSRFHDVCDPFFHFVQALSALTAKVQIERACKQNSNSVAQSNGKFSRGSKFHAQGSFISNTDEAWLFYFVIFVTLHQIL